MTPFRPGFVLAQIAEVTIENSSQALNGYRQKP
jgi:hypothetical protein